MTVWETPTVVAAVGDALEATPRVRRRSRTGLGTLLVLFVVDDDTHLSTADVAVVHACADLSFVADGGHYPAEGEKVVFDTRDGKMRVGRIGF